MCKYLAILPLHSRIYANVFTRLTLALFVFGFHPLSTIPAMFWSEICMRTAWWKRIKVSYCCHSNPINGLLGGGEQWSDVGRSNSPFLVIHSHICCSPFKDMGCSADSFLSCFPFENWQAEEIWMKLGILSPSVWRSANRLAVRFLIIFAQKWKLYMANYIVLIFGGVIP